MTEDVDVVLRDGTTLRLRPATARDQHALEAMFEQLSPESLYFRFFGGRATPGLIDKLLGVGGHDAFTLVAECGERIVAVAQYARLPEAPTTAEAAFAVADEMQGRGIGTRLLEQLASHARASGLTAFRAWVLGGNHRMLRVFVDSGFAIQSKTDQGVIEVALSLEPSVTHAARNAARASTAARASLGAFFTPSSVALVGARRDGAGVGAAILNNLQKTGYRGRIVPIHPSATELQGLRAYPSLTAVPGDVDLAVISVPTTQVASVARDAAAKHVKALVVITAGFSETGAAGRAFEAELLDIVRSAGMRMIGPNCMGVLNAAAGVRLNATFASVFPPDGRIAFSTQSGALGLAILDYARRIDLGLSTFASIGNKADVSSNDLIRYWADDAGTAVILLYLESFGNPRTFGQLARDVGRRKPIVALKAGRSAAGARAASSHTGALASSDTIVDALFKHAGVIRTTTIEEMFDVAMLLDRQPLPAGPRVAILTNAGGPGILAADACEGRGLHVATLREDTIAALGAFLPAAAGLHNPVDMLATAPAAHYGQAIRILLADPEVDALLTIFIPPLVTAAADVAAAIRDAASTASKPVLATFMAGEEGQAALRHIPTYRFPEAGVAALARVVEYAGWRSRPEGTYRDFSAEVAAARVVVAGPLARGDGWLTPADAQAVLDAMQIPVARSRVIDGEDDAVRRAESVGYPVALKAFGPAILHKSDADAIRLGLANEAAVRVAFRDLHGRLGPRMSGMLVQRMDGGGVEMFVGGLQDPAFGPVVFCGSGGVLVELFGDAACRLCPVSSADVDRMLDEVRGARRLRGYRGAAPSDEAAFKDVVWRVSALLDGCPEILELDLNPVSVFADRVAALDVRIRVGPLQVPPSTRRVHY